MPLRELMDNRLLDALLDRSRDDGTELSAESVSRITDAVLEEVRAWQDRPLDPVWAVVFLDAIVVKVRDNHVVQNKPACIALGVNGAGEKHVLGIWLARTPLESAAAGESARFRASITADLRNRGVRDILIACCDGLASRSGCPEGYSPGW